MSQTAEPHLLGTDTSNVLRVLMIDDDEADYWIVRNLLEYDPNNKAGDKDRPRFITLWADTFTKGKILSVEQAPDIILLDYLLPDSEGLQGLKQLVENQPDIPVIILTGIDSEDLGKDAIVAGAQDFLPKVKIGWEELTRKIRYATIRHLRLKRGMKGSHSEFSKDTEDWHSYRAAVKALKQSVS